MHRALGLLLTGAVVSSSACGGIVSDQNDGTHSPLGGENADAADAITPPPAVDAGDPPIAIDADDRPASAPIAEACAPGTPSRPDAFVSFDYMREHAPGCGGASTCATSFELTADCRVSGRHLSGTYTASLSPSDCLALKSWATSTRLLDGIRDETICPGSAATWNPDQIATHTSDGTVNRKLDPMCDASPFRENRACLEAVLNAYVPGPSFYP